MSPVSSPFLQHSQGHRASTGWLRQALTWSGVGIAMAGGQREQVAACGLCFARKMLLPMCRGASVPLCLQLGPCLSVALSGRDACLHASPPRSRQDVCSVGRASQSSGFVWKRDACRGLTQAHHAWDARAGCRPQPCPAVRAGCLRRQQDLFRVLKAYTLYRPEEGYCQAQAPIAAVLLMHMPAEVRAHSSGDRLAPPRGCGALWGADEWGVHLGNPKCPRGALLLPTLSYGPWEEATVMFSRCSPAVPWLAASVLVPGADL